MTFRTPCIIVIMNKMRRVTKKKKRTKLSHCDEDDESEYVRIEKTDRPIP
jgi:hypothetical protein